MNATIFLADAAIRDPIVELICACRDHVQQKRPSDAEIASSVERLLADPATDFLVAMSAQSAAMGYVQLHFHYSLWVNGLQAQLEDLFVAAPFRCRGIGFELVQAAVTRAKEREARFIWLNTNERNFDAMRLYTKAGFSSARERWQGGRQLWLERAL
jgi:ribosomal protein S18 acetylase RimI-like enzyme